MTNEVADEQTSFAVVVSEGTYDKAMMSMMLANTAASMGKDVHVFFTFFGLNLLKKRANPKLPGLFRLMTGWFRKRMKKVGVEDFSEQVEMAKELGVHLYACSTTMNVMGIEEKDLIDGIKVLGAASFLNIAEDAGIELFIG